MEISEDLALLRLVAQRLAGTRWAGPVEAVARLGATQAQDLPGALTSVALRTRSGKRAEVEAAVNAGLIVRSWPMRGTLHLVAAEDLGWLLSLTGPRMIAAAASRRVNLAITDAIVDHSRQIALEALSGGAQLPRQALSAHWRDAGLLSQPQAAYHLLARLCQEATLVLGPLEGSEQLVVGYAQWVPNPRQLSADDALAELARRYIFSHGPVTAADFARWSSLTLTNARAGFAAVRGECSPVTINGTEHLMDPALTELLAAHRTDARRLLLLPGFDEFILGYADRSFTVPAAFADRIVPGSNGMFRPTILTGGQVIGTWKRAGTKTKSRIASEGFGNLSALEQAEAERAFADLPTT